jgi:hypothetical protein
MNNKEKLEFLLKLQRRDRNRRIIIGIIFIAILGAASLFTFYDNYDIGLDTLNNP